MSARIRGADPEARYVIGVMFRLLALKIQPRVLREWLDWQGCVKNVDSAMSRAKAADARDAIETLVVFRERTAARLPALLRFKAERGLLLAEAAFRAGVLAAEVERLP